MDENMTLRECAEQIAGNTVDITDQYDAHFRQVTLFESNGSLGVEVSLYIYDYIDDYSEAADGVLDVDGWMTEEGHRRLTDYVRVEQARFGHLGQPPAGTSSDMSSDTPTVEIYAVFAEHGDRTYGEVFGADGDGHAAIATFLNVTDSKSFLENI